MKNSLRTPKLAFVLAAVFALAQLAILPGMFNRVIEKDTEKTPLVDIGPEADQDKTLVEFSKGTQAESSAQY